jgi:hypothetical protein
LTDIFHGSPADCSSKPQFNEFGLKPEQLALAIVQRDNNPLWVCPQLFLKEKIMSEGNGIFLVLGEYEGNLEKIVETLNEWEFDAENKIHFSVYENYISTNKSGDTVTFPTVLPLKSWIVFRDGTRVRINKVDEAQLSRDDWDDEYEKVELSTIGERISPLLTKGTLELVSNSHNNTFAWRQRLIIDNHCAMYQGQCFRGRRKFKMVREKYEWRKNSVFSRILREAEIEA